MQSATDAEINVRQLCIDSLRNAIDCLSDAIRLIDSETDCITDHVDEMIRRGREKLLTLISELNITSDPRRLERLQKQLVSLRHEMQWHMKLSDRSWAELQALAIEAKRTNGKQQKQQRSSKIAEKAAAISLTQAEEQALAAL